MPLLPEESKAVEASSVKLKVSNEVGITTTERPAKALELMAESKVEPKGKESALAEVKGAAKVQLGKVYLCGRR